MEGKLSKHRWEDGKKVVIFSVILIFLAASIILFLSAKSSNKIVYVTTNGSRDFNCDGRRPGRDK